MHELPQTRELAAFAAVVEDGSFAEAGRRLGVAPSTLSRTVTRLETLLNVTLLRRSTRAIELTPEGRQLLAAAQEILRQTEALSDIAQGSRTPRGPLRVNAPVPFVLHAIAPRLEEFHARYPQVAVTLDMTDRPVDLIDSHADLAIRFGPLKDSDVLHRRLGRTAWKLCAAPAYLERTGWPAGPADLAGLSQVGFTAPAHINRLVFKDIGEVTLPTSVQAENGEAVRALVLGGMGVARFSDYMVADDLAAGRLVELFPGQLDTFPLDVTALYLTRTAGLRRLAVFLDWLREVLPDGG
ncbi:MULTISPECIES: LysR family transcriptional regulator [unclassified Sulfitobacter]|uniref:LysR family transcriptional regulator n=1 Tax=unclassified Sulfitobacter TaxID=196795 RepID=UPI003746505D